MDDPTASPSRMPPGLIMGSNIWLLPAGYIKMLQDTGTIGSRPEWMNAVIGAGKAISGFTIGMDAGI